MTIIYKPQSPQLVDKDTGNVLQVWLTVFTKLIDWVNGPFPMRPYAKANLPDPTKYPYSVVYVTDDAGGACLAVSNGTNWKKLTLGATVS